MQQQYQQIEIPQNDFTQQPNLNDSQEQCWRNLSNIQQNSTYQNIGTQQYNDSGNSNGPVFTEMKSIVVQEPTHFQPSQQSQMITTNDSSQTLHMPMQTSGYRIINNIEQNNDSQIAYVNPSNSTQQYHYISQNLSETNNSNGVFQVLFWFKNNSNYP